MDFVKWLNWLGALQGNRKKKKRIRVDKVMGNR